jgi:serine/threonine protein kinase
MFSHNIVKLVDLGIAQKAYEHRIGQTGTIPYSAPEVTTATESHVTITTSNADMWSWGAVLYRMTYMTRPTYESPCYSPPMNQNQARDPHLLDVLRHTLVKNPHSRPEPPWLAKHPYTKTP